MEHRDPIRVLFYAPMLGRGGVHRFTIDLLQSLHRVTTPDLLETFVLGQPIDEWGQPIEWVNENFIALNPPMSPKTQADPNYRFHQLRRYGETWFRQLQQVVDEKRIDIVYLAHPWWTFRFPAQNAKLNAHVTLTLFDFAFDTLGWNNEFGDAFREEARRFAAIASHTAFFSSPTREHGIQHYAFAEERTSVIWPGPFLPQGFDASMRRAEEIRTKYKLPHAYLLAFHSAGHKRPSTIIQAASLLKKTAPELFRPLVFAGLETDLMHPSRPTTNPYTAECQRLVVEGGLIPDEDIFFVGRVADNEIGGIYANAVISVTASQSEAGLPGPIFETLKAEVPLVYSAIAPHVDRLGRDNQYGRHFTLDDVQDCARAITTVLADYPAAKQIARHAKRDLLDSYSWDDAARRYFEVFTALRAQPPLLPVYTARAQVAMPHLWSANHLKYAQAVPESPIQVLIYAPVVGRGGVRRLVERLLGTWLKYTDRERWRFKVLGHAVDEIGKPIDWQADDILIPLEPRIVPDKDPSGIFSMLLDNKDAFHAQFLDHARNADVVWLPHPWWTLRFDDPSAFNISAHVIPTVHDFGFDILGWVDSFSNGFRDEARTFGKIATKMIFSSDTTRQYAHQKYGMSQEKGEVIHLGDFIPEDFHPDMAAFEALQQKHGLPDTFMLAFHASGHKDPKTIIQATALLRDTHPDLFCPLVIAGIETDQLIPGAATHNTYSAGIQEDIVRLGLEIGKDLFILGFMTDDEINGLYAGASACITASRSEAGLSAAVFEAFAARKPLIYSDLPQFVERLGVQKEYGVHFRMGNAESLMQAMAETFRSPAAAHTRTERGYELFASRTWKDIALDYLDVFEQAAQQPVPARPIPLNAEPAPEILPVSPIQPDAAPVPHQHTVVTSSTEEQDMPAFGTRAKIYALNKLLPKVNLTSYNALRRAHGLVDEANFQRKQTELDLQQADLRASIIEQQLNAKGQEIDIKNQEIELLAQKAAQLETLTQGLHTLRHEIDIANQTMTALQSQLDAKDRSLEDASVYAQIKEAELQHVSAALQRSNDELSQLHDELRKVTEERQQVTEAIAVLEANLAAAQQETRVAATQHEQTLQDMARLSSEHQATADAAGIVRQQFNYQTKQFAAFIRQPESLRTAAQVNAAGLNPVERVIQFQKMINRYTMPLEALSVLEQLPGVHDEIYTSVLLPLYQQKLGGTRESFWDIRMALNVLTRIIQPRNYLEVGTRLGWSLAQVIANMPTVKAYSLDNWMLDYAGTTNPGAAFVGQQMQQLVPENTPLNLQFISGNSHDTLPQLFFPDRYPREFDVDFDPTEMFDLITVDGDHTLLGAWWDLDILFSRVAVGGAIIFDDLEIETTTTDEVPETRYPECYAPIPSNLVSLRDVWAAMNVRHPQFVTITTGNQPIATAIAIRME